MSSRFSSGNCSETDGGSWPWARAPAPSPGRTPRSSWRTCFSRRREPDEIPEASPDPLRRSRRSRHERPGGDPPPLDAARDLRVRPERGENTDRLAALGAKILFGHDPGHLAEVDLVVVSSAVDES